MCSHLQIGGWINNIQSVLFHLTDSKTPYPDQSPPTYGIFAMKSLHSFRSWHIFRIPIRKSRNCHSSRIVILVHHSNTFSRTLFRYTWPLWPMLDAPLLQSLYSFQFNFYLFALLHILWCSLHRVYRIWNRKCSSNAIMVYCLQAFRGSLKVPDNCLSFHPFVYSKLAFPKRYTLHSTEMERTREIESEREREIERPWKI